MFSYPIFFFSAISVCNLPQKMGMCRASQPRWHFNKDTNQCEEFIYGGCGGNENNFLTKEQCDNRYYFALIMCISNFPDCFRFFVMQNIMCIIDALMKSCVPILLMDK